MDSLVRRIDYEKSSVSVHLDNIDYLYYREAEGFAILTIGMLSTGKEVVLKEQDAVKFPLLLKTYLDLYTRWHSVMPREMKVEYNIDD